MKAKTIVPIVALVVILGAGALYFSRTGGYSAMPQPGQGSQNTQTPDQSSCQKFSDSQYSSYSYLISGNQLSPDVQAALSGFQMNKTVFPNGNTTISLTPTDRGSNYHFQTFSLRPGDKLYFLEISFGDDAPQQDTNLRDDSGILVDSNGCIIG